MSTHEERKLLRTNQHGPSLQLWLDETTNRRAITEALRANRTVKTVSIFLEKGYMEATAVSLKALFQSIGCLPVERIYLYAVGGETLVMPVNLLTAMLQYALHLEEFAMYFIELGGQAAHCGALEQVIMRLVSLKEFRLENCRFSDAILRDREYVYDRFVKSLAQTENLEKVELLASDMGFLGNLTATGLQTIGASPHLKSLALYNYTLTNEHISALNKAINKNPNFSELTLSCNSEYVSKLPALIAKSDQLSYVTIHLESFDNEAFLSKMAKAVGMNPWLVQFELKSKYSQRMNVMAEQAFVEALERNPYMEKMGVLITERKLNKKSKLYLKLNQTGKRAMFQDSKSTKPELVDALIYVKQDLDCLYHFLSLKPTLCQQ